MVGKPRVFLTSMSMDDFREEVQELLDNVSDIVVLHIIFIIPMTVNDVNLFFSFTGVSGLSS